MSSPGSLSGSDPPPPLQPDPGPRRVAELKVVLSRARILGMQGSIWLASGRQGGGQTWTFSFCLVFGFCTKPSPHQGLLPGEVEARGMSRELLVPSPDRFHHVHSRGTAGEEDKHASSPFRRPCLCVWKFLSRSWTICAIPSGSFQLDCRHLVAGSGGHIGPCPSSPLLSWVPSVLFFVSPTSYELEFYNPALWV